MKQKGTYILPTIYSIAVAACNNIMQASHGFPQISVDDNSITYEKTDDSFRSDESVAAKGIEMWDEDWEEEEDL